MNAFDKGVHKKLETDNHRCHGRRSGGCWHVVVANSGAYASSNAIVVTLIAGSPDTAARTTSSAITTAGVRQPMSVRTSVVAAAAASRMF